MADQPNLGEPVVCCGMNSGWLNYVRMICCALTFCPCYCAEHYCHADCEGCYDCCANTISCAYCTPHHEDIVTEPQETQTPLK